MWSETCYTDGLRDLLNHTKVAIGLIASFKQSDASFIVNLDELDILPDTVVASSEGLGVFLTRHMNSKATFVVLETPFEFSNHNVVNDPEGTPTKPKDINAEPVDDSIGPGLDQHSEQESRAGTAKRKADSIHA
jgi:hypothetical protein